MRGRTALTTEEMLVALGAIAVLVLACLSPVHNDTWWHLAYGREMAADGGFAQIDRFSHTAYGQPFPNHQWLSQRIFNALYQAGGLPLLTAGCASLLTAAWVLSWRLSRGEVAFRLLVMAGAVSASTLVWSIRPQVFTIALLPFTLTLLSRERLVWLPLVTLVWANLHGGVLLGIVAIGVWTAVACLSRGAVNRRWIVALAASMATTLVTPLGLRYWPEIFASLGRSQVNRLHEWQAPGLPPDNFFFWIAVAALVWLAATRWRRLEALSDRALVATALALVAPASRTLRNIAPFAVVAGPAITVLVSATRSQAQLPGARSRAAVLTVLAAAACAMAIVGWAWTSPWTGLGWRPLPDGAIAAVRACPAPLFNTYGVGGPLIWFAPEQAVFVDSRQDQYPVSLIQEAAAVEHQGNYRGIFDRHGIRCALLPALSPTATALGQDGWRTTFVDDRWVVLERAPSVNQGG